MPHVGFYVHYHGRGHKHRTEAILEHLTVMATVVTSRSGGLQWSGPTLGEVIDLPCDNDGLNEDGLRAASNVPALHFAPLWSDNVASRVANYTAWLADKRPDVMVVDVSAEISMLTRLSGVPQVVMRQHGDRNDAAHASAYAAAHSLLAPFPKMMEDERTPPWVRNKTVYLNGFCRSTNEVDVAPRASCEPLARSTKDIVFLFGRGGDEEVHERLRRAAELLPSHRLLVLGKEADTDRDRDPSNLHYLGWVDDVSTYTDNAEVVVTAAGHNSVMELGSRRRPFIAVAESRPFDEQVRKAEVLQREGLAIGLDRWPSDDAWPSLIVEAKQINVTRWDEVFANDGAQQAAKHINDVACWSLEQRRTPAEISL
ncbi:glycosyltransferase [Rubripirellula obstinata]|nr:glycosyltransferase [Rubripirellula obstinata]